MLFHGNAVYDVLTSSRADVGNTRENVRADNGRQGIRLVRGTRPTPAAANSEGIGYGGLAATYCYEYFGTKAEIRKSMRCSYFSWL